MIWFPVFIYNFANCLNNHLQFLQEIKSKKISPL